METHKLKETSGHSAHHFIYRGLLFLMVGFLWPGSEWIPSAHAASTPIVVSQVYGGGGNSGSTYRNDFIELFNRGNEAINVTGWSVQYTSAAGTSWQKTELSGSIVPGHYYLVQEAQGSGGTTNLPTPDVIGTIPLSATAGKIVLVNNNIAITSGTSCPSGTSIINVVGFGSGATCFEGAAPTPAPSSTQSILRAGNGCTDTGNNSTDFATGSPNPRNSASATNMCGGTADPKGVGEANPASISAGGTTILTVKVTPGTNPSSTGISVSGDLTPIGGAAVQQFFDDGSHGDASVGDNIFSFQATVSSGTTAGAKDLMINIADAQLRHAITTIQLTVQSPSIPIHDIQGSGQSSPHLGEVVTTTGIVTGVRKNAFYLQTPDAQIDNDPNTSEGITVVTTSAPPPAIVVGNLVTVTGTVREFVPASDPDSPPVTQISEPVAVALISTGNALPAPVDLTAADTSPTGSIHQLGRFEGMRVHVDSLTVIAPTEGLQDEANATSASTGVFYAVLTGIARPFREPGIAVSDPLPPGSPCCIPRFDTNPERLRIDSIGQVGALPLEVTTEAKLTGVTGPLDYSNRTYTIVLDPAPLPVVSGMISAIPVSAVASDEFTVSSFNMERFYDATDDPSSIGSVLSAVAFNHRLNKVSLAIRNVLRLPDIIGVEEVENLLTLQAVADKVNQDAIAAGEPNPMYQGYLIEGNDPGGIDVGFLVKSSRVGTIDVIQAGKSDTYLDPITNQPEILNDRPPLMLRATLLQGGASSYPVTVVVNHLRSLSGIDDSVEGGRVRAKRLAQAEFLANFIQSRQAADPNGPIIVLGDFNAFQFNDGYADVIGTIKGAPAPFDQVVLGSHDLVNPDLTDLVDLIPDDQRYSFSLDGNAQVLDHILVTGNLLPRFVRLNFARNNVDFPESFRNDANRPERISDHDMPVAYFSFSLPGADLSIEKSYSSDPVQPGGQFKYLLKVTNRGPAPASSVEVRDMLDANTTFYSITSPTGWSCVTPPVGDSGWVSCTKRSLDVHSVETFLLTVRVNCSLETGTVLTSTATINSLETDSDPANNLTASTVTVFDATTISPPSQSFGASGGLGTVSIDVPNGCSWTAKSDARWITITSTDVSASGGNLNYAVAANGSASARTGTMTIAGQTCTVSQLGSGGGNSQFRLSLPGGGVGTALTEGGGGIVLAGYAVVSTDPGKRSGDSEDPISGTGPDGTAVLSLTQNGVVVSEAGVPPSPPTTRARVFIDYRTNVLSKVDQQNSGSISVNTGFSIVNRGTATANISYQLRSSSGVVLASGHGTLAQSAHRALFIHELSQIAPDFALPPDFSTATGFGTLEMSSDEPISILGLRLTVNQHGETLLTTTPIADLTRPFTSSPLFFPQIVVGGGYGTTIILLNNSNSMATGTLRIFDNNGSPLLVRQAGSAGVLASSFAYNIPPGGFYVFQTDGSQQEVVAGWAQIEPSPGSSAPTGAGLLSLSSGGILRSETGIPAATLTSHARVYVDRSGGHNTGMAIAVPSGSGLHVTMEARQGDGRTVAGSGTLDLRGNGHDARFANEFIPALPEGFTGVLDISAPVPFAALTLRSLTNSRGDFLLTTFPIVDSNQPAAAPLVFPQIATGGGYQTQCVLFGSRDDSNALISYYGDDGTPLNAAKRGTIASGSGRMK